MWLLLVSPNLHSLLAFEKTTKTTWDLLGRLSPGSLVAPLMSSAWSPPACDLIRDAGQWRCWGWHAVKKWLILVRFSKLAWGVRAAPNLRFPVIIRHRYLSFATFHFIYTIIWFLEARLGGRERWMKKKFGSRSKVCQRSNWVSWFMGSRAYGRCQWMVITSIRAILKIFDSILGNRRSCEEFKALHQKVALFWNLT